MKIACDEAGHTGPDLLSKDQRYFAFASVNISDDEAWQLIKEARKRFPVQMPELKAAKLMSSKQGQRLIAFIIGSVEGRFAISANDKLVALCGWLFEYIFEPVIQSDPDIFYQKEFHRFVAMFSYMWFQESGSEAQTAITQFQDYMRSKDISSAPFLFDNNWNDDGPTANGHPFELILRFASGFREIIASDNASIEHVLADGGAWVLDLSASAFWSHLNHWGKKDLPLEVICDESKPLKAIEPDLRGDELDPAILRMREIGNTDPLGWKLASPIEFVDSRNRPSVQIADVLASTVVRIYSTSLPDGLREIAPILDSGMLKDSTFPDFNVIDLEKKEVAVNHLILFELAVRASRGNMSGVDIREYYRVAERTWVKGG